MRCRRMRRTVTSRHLVFWTDGPVYICSYYFSILYRCSYGLESLSSMVKRKGSPCKTTSKKKQTAPTGGADHAELQPPDLSPQAGGSDPRQDRSQHLDARRQNVTPIWNKRFMNNRGAHSISRRRGKSPIKIHQSGSAFAPTTRNRVGAPIVHEAFVTDRVNILTPRV